MRSGERRRHLGPDVHDQFTRQRAEPLDTTGQILAIQSLHHQVVDRSVHVGLGHVLVTLLRTGPGDDAGLVVECVGAALAASTREAKRLAGVLAKGILRFTDRLYHSLKRMTHEPFNV